MKIKSLTVLFFFFCYFFTHKSFSSVCELLQISWISKRICSFVTLKLSLLYGKNNRSYGIKTSNPKRPWRKQTSLACRCCCCFFFFFLCNFWWHLIDEKCAPKYYNRFLPLANQLIFVYFYECVNLQCSTNVLRRLIQKKSKNNTFTIFFYFSQYQLIYIA